MTFMQGVSEMVSDVCRGLWDPTPTQTQQNRGRFDIYARRLEMVSDVCRQGCGTQPLRRLNRTEGVLTFMQGVSEMVSDVCR